MRSLAPSRADQVLTFGMTPKKLAARTKTAIAEIEKRIEALAMPYAEVDNSIVGAQAELAAAFEIFKNHILDTQRYLEEAAP